MAGLVPAIHEAPPEMVRLIEKHYVGSTSYPDRAVFSWVAGSKPGHDSESGCRGPTVDALRVRLSLDKIRIRRYTYSY
jgi:hypothetical protein